MIDYQTITNEEVVWEYTNYSESFVFGLNTRYIPYDEYYPAYKDVI